MKFSENISVIEDECFSGCIKLSGLSIPEGCIGIGRSAFEGCSAITAVRFPAEARIVDPRAFANCPAVSIVVFNEKIKQIADDVFAGDFGIKSVSVPKNLTRAACELFRHQDSLADDNGFLIINDVFVHYFGDGKEVTVPDRIRAIDDGAFAENTVIEKVTLPGTVERIGLASFGACASLKGINFPEGLISIGSFAFALI